MESYRQEKIDTVYHLIQSLSEHEMVRITEYARIFDDQANQLHMQMLRFLREENGYDHQALKDFMPGKQVSRIKNYLHKFIYKALAAAGLHPHGDLSFLLSEIAIAFRKKSPFQAKTSIVKAKEIARERELFLVHLDLLQRERKWLLKYEGETVSSANLEAIWTEHDEINVLQANLAHYFRLKEKYYYPLKYMALKTGKMDRGLLEQLANEEAIQSDQFPLSDRARIERYALWTIYHRGTGDYGAALETVAREVDVFLGLEWLQVEEQERFFNVVHRASLIASSLENEERAGYYLSLLAKADDGTFNTGLHLWVKWYFAASIYADCFQNPEVREDAIRKLESWYSQVEPHLQKEEKIRLLWKYMSDLMKARKYKKAKKIIPQMLDLRDEEIKTEMQMVCRIIHMIILFEEEDGIGLDSHGRNYQRFTKKISGNSDLSYLIIRFLRNSPNYIDRGKLKIKMEQLAQTIESRWQKPETQHLLNYFDFKKWLDEKLEGFVD